MIAEAILGLVFLGHREGPTASRPLANTMRGGWVPPRSLQSDSFPDSVPFDRIIPEALGQCG